MELLEMEAAAGRGVASVSLKLLDPETERF